LEREFLAAASDGYFGRLTMMGQLLLAVVICGSYAAVLFGAVFGICCMPPADPRTHWFLILSILFPCAIHTLIFAHSRYHLPIVPLLAVYAAATIVRRNDIWQQRRSIVFGTASVTCFVLVLGWLRELVFVDFEAVRRVLS
jgi:hypothetical protein